MTKRRTEDTLAKPKKPRAPKAKRNKPPHNAKEREYGSLEELIDVISNEPRPWKKDGKPVRITRLERMFRKRVEGAMEGHPKDVREMLRLIMAYPGLGRSHHTEWVVELHGPLANL